MKKIISTSIILFVLFTACGPSHVMVQSTPPPPAPPPPAPEVTYQSFYDELSPYGHWVSYPGYGYVWMPAVAPGFRPYATNGHWVYTDMGWTWASDYNWGWATFHYGRWFFDGAYGWMWVPGNEWAPAWVSWRTNTDYYGWAPLGPNIGYNTPYYNPPVNYWCFVPHQYVASPHVNNYYVNESRNVTIVNNSTVINNVTVNNTRINNTTNNTVVNNNVRNVFRGGPDPKEVERAGGEPVRTIEVRENNRPGEQVNNNEFAIYRPRVNATPAQGSTVNNQQRIIPSKVESLHDFKPNTSNNTAPAQANNPVQGNRNTGLPATEPADPRHENPTQNTRQDTRDNFNNQVTEERHVQQGQNVQGNGHQDNPDNRRNLQSAQNVQGNGHQNDQDDHKNFQSGQNGQGNGHQNNPDDHRNFQSVSNDQANGHQNSQENHHNNLQAAQNSQGNGHQNNQNNKNSNPQLQNQQQKNKAASNGGNAKPKTLPKPQDKNGNQDDKHKDKDSDK